MMRGVLVVPVSHVRVVSGLVDLARFMVLRGFAVVTRGALVVIGGREGDRPYLRGDPSAELVAALTIGAADRLGLTVSATHVLSSGIAGTMWANKSGLQRQTLRNLLLAWVLTLPVCVLLGAGIFAFGINMVLKLGWK
jgi:phosphate/sulfate permease